MEGTGPRKMGSWDCYCTICGGPSCSIDVARRARSKGFKPRLARTLAKRKAGTVPDHEWLGLDLDANLSESDEEKEDRSEDEEYTYDRDILTEGDIEWSKTFYVLAVSAGGNDERR